MLARPPPSADPTGTARGPRGCARADRSARPEGGWHAARVDRERTVCQPDHGADILAEASQHLGGVGKDARVALPHLERPPREIDGLAAGCLWLRGPAVIHEPLMADRRPGKCRPVVPI